MKPDLGWLLMAACGLSVALWVAIGLVCLRGVAW